MKVNKSLALIGTTFFIGCNIIVSSPGVAQTSGKNIDRLSETNSHQQDKESPNSTTTSPRENIPQQNRESNRGDILYNPPPSSQERQVNITRRTGSGIRGTCVEENSPQTLLAPLSHVGLTTQSHPQLAIYFPEAPKLTVSINIEDPEAKEVLWVKQAKIDSAGIYSFKIPENTPGLIADRRYDWTVSLICDRNKRQVDIFAEVPLIRKEISPQLQGELAEADDNISKARILARSGFFYDALAELLTSNSSQAGVLVRSLLAQTGLQDIQITRSTTTVDNLQ